MSLRCGDYGHRNKAGGPCGAQPIRGTQHCRAHAGKPLALAKAEGAIRLAVIRWNVDQPHIDPVETYMRLATVTAARAEWLAELLEQAYDAAEQVAAAARDGADDGVTGEAVRLLDDVLSRGGVSALVGKQLAADGDGGVFVAGEAVRALAKLEQDERKLAADMAFKAIAAGLGDRIARIPHQVAEQVAETVQRIVAGLGFDPSDPQIRRYIAEHLRAAAGGPPAGRLLAAEQQGAVHADVRRVNASPAAGWRPGQ